MEQNYNNDDSVFSSSLYDYIMTRLDKNDKQLPSPTIDALRNRHQLSDSDKELASKVEFRVGLMKTESVWRKV